MLTANEKRIIDLSYKYKLSHLGSCLTSLPIIEEIYKKKKPMDKFVLSEGHAHLAHLVVMEEYGLVNAEEALKYGIHCDRKAGCDASTGSLGQGLPIAVGMALANRNKWRNNVYCLISDGECAEGSIWESLRIIDDLDIRNIHIYVNSNGYGAYKEIRQKQLENRLNDFASVRFYYTNMNQYPNYLQGLEGHYHVLGDKEYESFKK